MNKNKGLHDKSASQDQIDIIEQKYARLKENEPMKILLNAAKEYLTEKGQEKNGS
ncbi:MAG: hypothetical protein JEZ12_07565 [Desulfobacterium sp.]|nr:hypothetical protein [Desulfobacterium sp.]